MKPMQRSGEARCAIGSNSQSLVADGILQMPEPVATEVDITVREITWEGCNQRCAG
jgi:hypothetical protein